MKILVTGGRDFNDYETVAAALRRYINPGDDDSIVIHGGATGADRCARNWCEANGVHHASVPALWDWWGKSAGPRRNRAMAYHLSPELVLAFPGGKGTEDMVKQAQKFGYDVMRVSSPVGKTSEHGK